MSEQEEQRKQARDLCTRNLVENERKLGKDVSEDTCRRYVNKRADVQDKRKDFGEIK
jgi:hypothetical protein